MGPGAEIFAPGCPGLYGIQWFPQGTTLYCVTFTTLVVIAMKNAQ